MLESDETTRIKLEPTINKSEEPYKSSVFQLHTTASPGFQEDESNKVKEEALNNIGTDYLYNSIVTNNVQNEAQKRRESCDETVDVKEELSPTNNNDEKYNNTANSDNFPVQSLAAHMNSGLVGSAAAVKPGDVKSVFNMGFTPSSNSLLIRHLSQSSVKDYASKRGDDDDLLKLLNYNTDWEEFNHSEKLEKLCQLFPDTSDYHFHLFIRTKSSFKEAILGLANRSSSISTSRFPTSSANISKNLAAFDKCASEREIVKRLKERFPCNSIPWIRDILRQHDGDEEAVAKILGQYIQDTSTECISPIKQRRAHKSSLPLSESSDEGSELCQWGTTSRAQAMRNKSRGRKSYLKGINTDRALLGYFTDEDSDDEWFRKRRRKRKLSSEEDYMPSDDVEQEQPINGIVEEPTPRKRRSRRKYVEEEEEEEIPAAVLQRGVRAKSTRSYTNFFHGKVEGAPSDLDDDDDANPEDVEDEDDEYIASSDDEGKDYTKRVRVKAMRNKKSLNANRKRQRNLSDDDPDFCVSSRKKKKPIIKVLQSDDDDDGGGGDWVSDESWHANQIHDLKKVQIQAILRFFDTASSIEMTSLPGISSKKALLIINERPINGWDKILELFSKKPLNQDILLEVVQLLDERRMMNELLRKCEQISKQIESVIISKRFLVNEEPKNEITQSLTSEMSINPDVLGAFDENSNRATEDCDIADESTSVCSMESKTLSKDSSSNVNSPCVKAKEDIVTDELSNYQENEGGQTPTQSSIVTESNSLVEEKVAVDNVDSAVAKCDNIDSSESIKQTSESQEISTLGPSISSSENCDLENTGLSAKDDEIAENHNQLQNSTSDVVHVKTEDTVTEVAETDNSEDLFDGSNDDDTLLGSDEPKCETATDEAAIESTGEENTPSKEFEINNQPSLLNPKMSLKPYQLIGVNWLYLMFQQNLSCILADQMGLGKTVQTIALFAYLKQKKVRGPFVVVAPSSTLENWQREFTQWCPDLVVLTYYGSQDERREIRNEIRNKRYHYDVILTTYSVCISSGYDRSFFQNILIKYIVMDEGHMLKNMSSNRYKYLMRIQAEHRLLLTGTPLQNNLVELMSVLTFIMPDLFHKHNSIFSKLFSRASKTDNEDSSEYEKMGIEQAKTILRPFILRRTKAQVLKQLPEKKIHILKCPMTKGHLKQYDDMKEAVTHKIANDEGRNLAGSIMQLRKAANHPLLHRSKYHLPQLKKITKLLMKLPEQRKSTFEFVLEDLTVMSDYEIHSLCCEHPSLKKHRLKQESILDSAKFVQLDELLARFKENGDRVLLFSQFVILLNVLEAYLKIRGHNFIRLDGSTPVTVRQDLIDEFNNSPEIFVFLLSTRAGGLGINLTAANVVILHDLDFNPYNDIQAEDRCHRVGQTKNVNVYKMVTENTIEEGILKISEAKLKLEQGVAGFNDDDETASADVAKLLKECLDV